MNNLILPREFYLRDDVVLIARQLLGKILYTSFDGAVTSGMITETEAYAGIADKASHAYGGRRTSRTEIMYRQGGTAYVYLCYGVHSLFNIVTSKVGNPHAVLIRGIVPNSGITEMQKRVGAVKLKVADGNGPGKAAKLLRIHYSHSGMDLCSPDRQGNRIWLQDEGILAAESDIKITKRIGVDYAGDDATLPYRFVWVQKK